MSGWVVALDDLQLPYTVFWTCTCHLAQQRLELA